MITEELKQNLDLLPSEVHEQARELVKTWTNNINRVSEEPELPEDESDALEQTAEEAKDKLFILFFGPLYYPYTSQYVSDENYYDEEEQFLEDLSKYYNL